MSSKMLTVTKLLLFITVYFLLLLVKKIIFIVSYFSWHHVIKWFLIRWTVTSVSLRSYSLTDYSCQLLYCYEFQIQRGHRKTMKLTAVIIILWSHASKWSAICKHRYSLKLVNIMIISMVQVFSRLEKLLKRFVDIWEIIAIF